MSTSSRRTCAFLTISNPVGYVMDDTMAAQELEQRGWSVESIDWETDTDWSRFDCAVIRTTWNYTQKPAEFLKKMRKIAGMTRLLNPLEMIEWNINKKYLLELQSKGVTVTPTVAKPGNACLLTQEEWASLGSPEKLMLKPTIGASAGKTLPLFWKDWSSRQNEISQMFVGHEVLVQPFLDGVLDQGECSLFYFGGVYSHSIRKVPKQGDYRVQEEHGGDISARAPSEEEKAWGLSVIQSAPAVPTLFGRVDYVVDSTGTRRLMELEMIEPALYFRMSSDAASRFADVFERFIG